jgi:hypothetical protein
MRCYPFLLMIMILLMIFQGIVANRKDQEHDQEQEQDGNPRVACRAGPTLRILT